MSGVCNDCHNHPCVCGMDQAGSDVERGVRRDLPFLGLLSPEKTAAIMRGERVQITGEEAGLFCAQMNLIRDRRTKELERLLRRYRKETPLGHQPHMIAHEVDAVLGDA